MLVPVTVVTGTTKTSAHRHWHDQDWHHNWHTQGQVPASGTWLEDPQHPDTIGQPTQANPMHHDVTQNGRHKWCIGVQKHANSIAWLHAPRTMVSVRRRVVAGSSPGPGRTH